MADLGPVLRFWRAHDDLFDRTEAMWWGAVVSDARFPAIHEPNYARVETGQPVRLEEIEDALVPAMRASGSERSHVVIFHPGDQTELVAAASTRGDRIAWDLVMVAAGRDVEPAGEVEEVSAFDASFWAVHRESARLFDISNDDTLDQLQAMERDVLAPAGRRWFSVLDGGGRSSRTRGSRRSRSRTTRGSRPGSPSGSRRSRTCSSPRCARAAASAPTS